ncbi:Upstream-binding protein 1 [Armadillidium vulgare]|nr:Upstream-binding protein 1 [Armadillidium vulgare]
MGEPCDKVEEMNQPVRNRKRFLEASEDQHEAETNSRRQNLLSEWQETLKSMGVPSKKGFIGNESQYNDMIDQGLADNFEDSLSGLGVDITTASYNMSDAMLALPNVGLFKHEPNVLHHPKSSSSLPLSTSPSNFDESSQTYNNAADNNLNEDPASDVAPSEIQSEENYSMSSVVSEEIGDSIPSSNNLYENNRFQYILGAATSVAVKVNEESLTYLNQGQSYEIKVKKLGDITGCQGRLYHTKVRICFHERRLQYMEKEQMAQWKQMRPGERILEIDVPLSYGISDVIQDVKYLNVCEFNWDPTKEVGVYLKIPSNDDNPSVSTLNGTPGKAVGPSDLSRADSTGKTSPPNIKSISSEDRESPPEEAQKFLIGTPSVPYLDIDSTASDTQSWLVSNRFANVASVFSNFTGMDILRLSRGEVIEICGLVDGIRAVVPRLTLYLCLEPNVSYNAIYLKNLSLADFIKKIAELMKVSSECVHDVYIQGPSNINVHVTDEVVRNFKDESTFTVEILQDSSGEKFRILLRNSATTSAEATINSTCNH